jgi:hypothetical protein
MMVKLRKNMSKMEGMARDFFMQLYSIDQGVSPAELIQAFEPRISDEANAALSKEFSDDEINDAMFHIGPIKVPGPDGFLTRFFQRNWDTMKLVVIKGVKKFFESRHMPPAINEITVVLIPKKDEPELDSVPIPLCNVIYKVMSKRLVNRIRLLLHDIIEPTQSAFIPGRRIVGNVLIAFECLHAITNRNNKCRKFRAYKLDLTKAYDRVDWGFLEGVLKQLGFQSTWVQ